MKFPAACLCAAVLLTRSPLVAGSFAVQNGQFFLNGKSIRILSGEMHYPRIPRAYWRDRLVKARAMGLNTICTYLFWNAHEPVPGKFDFSGNLDVASFIRTAHEVGLNVIIRPGPYVCTEWDFGGLPPWLLRDPDIRIRCMDPRYMEAARRYIARVGRELAPLQITRGGPIILLQVENEYGSYGNDKVYLAELERAFRGAGFTIPFFTSDGSDLPQLEAGTLDNALPVVNFGGGAERQFAALDKYRTGIPQMCGEYWCGWFTHWGNTAWGGADMAAQKGDIEWMLRTGKSFNLYMVHGGTNFGFTAGANFTDHYLADVTSYDYDAPIDEAGRLTPKYTVLRDLIGTYAPGERPALPAPLPLRALPAIAMTSVSPLLTHLPRPVGSVQPRSMETFGQNTGCILYRTRLLGPRSGTLRITELHDYAIVFINGRRIGTIDRGKNESSIVLPPDDARESTLDILVEAMGRINFGSRMIDRKGITERVDLNGVTLMNWSVFPLPLDNGYLKELAYAPADSVAGPAFYKALFGVDEPADTYLDMSGWEKGVVWVNGRNLGRYWNVGPQRKLYLPGPWLRKGRNEIVVFDLAGGKPGTVIGSETAK
jgi:beta-galactosidase GanA